MTFPIVITMTVLHRGHAEGGTGKETQEEVLENEESKEKNQKGTHRRRTFQTREWSLPLSQKT